MTKTFPSWPAWFYGPNNQAQIFNKAEDVPEGWVDHPRKLVEDEDKTPPPKQNALPLTKEQIIEQLNQRGITFPKNASARALYDMLVEDVERKEA